MGRVSIAIPITADQEHGGHSMAEKDHDWHRQYSPNPELMVGKPDNEHPDAARARLYDYHKRAGTLATFFEMYPRDSFDLDRER